MPTAYLYVRVSKIDKEPGVAPEDLDSLGLQAQRREGARAVEQAVREGYADGGTFQDGNVSGKFPFWARPAGAKLNARLQRGDLIVFPVWDRAFRNLKEMCLSMEDWMKRGVHFLVVNIGVDTRRPDFEFTGKYMLYFLGAMAEWERGQACRRQQEVAAILKARGVYKDRVMAGTPPWGYRQEVVDGRLVNVPDERMQGIIKLILHLRDNHRQPWRKIAKILNARKLTTWDGLTWDQNRAWRCYTRVKARMGLLPAWAGIHGKRGRRAREYYKRLEQQKNNEPKQ